MTEGPWVAKWKQERRAEFLKGLSEMQRSESVRGVLQHLMETLADVSTFDLDPVRQAFLQGRRSVAMELRETLQEINFELYYRGIGERKDSARSYLAAKQNDADKVPLPKEK